MIVYALAVWRVTSIIHHEKIAESFRQSKLFGYDGISYPDTFAANLILCFWCLSVWIAALCFLLLWLFPYPLLVFAGSAVAILIEERFCNA